MLVNLALNPTLETQLKNAEEQQGFTKERSITDAVFITKQIKENATEFNTPAFICFVDPTMTFNRARWKDIQNILTENNVLANRTRTIHNLNTNNATRVNAEDQ